MFVHTFLLVVCFYLIPPNRVVLGGSHSMHYVALAGTKFNRNTDFKTHEMHSFGYFALHSILAAY